MKPLQHPAERTYTMAKNNLLFLRKGYAQFFFLAQKSNQKTWFSATLDFSLVFRWFSDVSPTLCTVVSKKTKLSCFWLIFFLGF
jgi:hypothetical protein